MHIYQLTNNMEHKMTSHFKKLIGHAVTNVINVQDYWQIFFGRDIINIYNPFKVVKYRTLLELDQLINLRLNNTVYDDTKKILFLHFDANIIVEIDLSEEQYSSSEGLSLNINGEPTVVF